MAPDTTSPISEQEANDALEALIRAHLDWQQGSNVTQRRDRWHMAEILRFLFKETFASEQRVSQMTLLGGLKRRVSDAANSRFEL